jgi:hypothetical protein
VKLEATATSYSNQASKKFNYRHPPSQKSQTLRQKMTEN